MIDGDFDDTSNFVTIGEKNNDDWDTYVVDLKEERTIYSFFLASSYKKEIDTTRNIRIGVANDASEPASSRTICPRVNRSWGAFECDAPMPAARYVFVQNIRGVPRIEDFITEFRVYGLSNLTKTASIINYSPADIDYSSSFLNPAFAAGRERNSLPYHCYT